MAARYGRRAATPTRYCASSEPHPATGQVGGAASNAGASNKPTQQWQFSSSSSGSGSTCAVAGELDSAACAAGAALACCRCQLAACLPAASSASKVALVNECACIKRLRGN